MIFFIKPLSVNKAWQGKRFKTSEYKQFEKDFSMLIKAQKMKKHLGCVRIDIGFSFKNSLSDIDNCLKPIFDVLVKNEIIKDDRFIVRLNVSKSISKNDFFYIEIYDTK